MAEKNLLQYEMMVILKPDLTQKATKEALQTIRSLLAEVKASINHEDLWEKRDLAYMMGKYEEGYYAVFYFTMDPKNLAELKADLDLEQTILRKMIIKFPQSLTLDSYLEEAKRMKTEQDAEDAERKAAYEKKQAEDAARMAARTKKKEETKTEQVESEIDAVAK